MSNARPRVLTIRSFPETAEVSDNAAFSTVPSYFIGQYAQQLAVFRRHVLKSIAEHTQPDNSPQYDHLVIDRTTVTIGYDATVFNNRAEVLKTLKTDEAADGFRGAEKWRSKTKERVITSQITCYAGTHSGLLEDPYKVILTTGCAVNFMGSSNKDEQEFLDGRRVERGQPGQMTFRNVKAISGYHDTMKRIFKRMLVAQDESGVQVTIFPVIGGGVYLCQLTDDHKEIARTRLFSAFVAALSELHFSHIREVVYAIPDKLMRDNTVVEDLAYQEASQIFTRYAPTKEHAPVLRLMNASMFSAAEFYHAQGWKVGLINPGSDRTIGGNFRKTLTDSSSTGTVTGEELICNLTNAAYVQAADLNLDLQKLDPKVYVRFPGTYLEDVFSLFADFESPVAPAAAASASSAPYSSRRAASSALGATHSAPYSSGRATNNALDDTMYSSSYSDSYSERPPSQPLRAAHSAPYSNAAAASGRDPYSAQRPYSGASAARDVSSPYSGSSSAFVSFPAPVSSASEPQRPRHHNEGHAARRRALLGPAASAPKPAARSLASHSEFYDGHFEGGISLFSPEPSSAPKAAAASSQPMSPDASASRRRSRSPSP